MMKTSHRRLIYVALGLGLLAILPLGSRFEHGGAVRRNADGGSPDAALSPMADAGAPVPEPRPSWPPTVPPVKPQRSIEAAQALSRVARGISAAPGQPEGTYVLRDQNASAFFNEKGVILALLGAAAPGAGPGDRRLSSLRWNAADAAEVKPRPVGELPGKFNSFVGPASGWVENASTYAAVEYDQVRPGVDLKVEARPHSLKYTLEARRARDVEGLKLRYEGATALRIVEDGRALEIETEAGTIREDGLICWQDVDGFRQPVRARYAAAEGDVYEISIEGAAPDAPLTIDPVIAWSSFMGGTQSPIGDDYVQGVAADAAGNVYLAGYTYTLNFPVGGASTPLSTVLKGQIDGFLIKLNSAGVFLWGTYVGGTNYDYVYAVAVDPGSGDAFITGNTSSTDFFTTAGAYDTTVNSTEAFVMRFNANGGLPVWSSYFGGTSSDYGQAIAVDASGVYFGGYTYSGFSFPLTGAFDATFGSGPDGFVAKLNLAGNTLIYSSYVGGSATDYVQGLAVNSTGECFVTGYTYSGDFNQAVGIDNVISSTPDAFLLKIKDSGSLSWSTFLGGSGSDYGYAVCVTPDFAQDPVVVGYTTSADFPLFAAWDPTFNSTEAFVTRVKSDGTVLIFSTFFGGTSVDYGYGVAPGAAGSGTVYISGYTASSNLPVSAGAFRTTSFGSYDSYVTQFNAAGLPLLSTYVGGNSLDYMAGFCVIPGGASPGVVVGGRTYSTDFCFPAASRPDSTLAGQTDGFAVKLPLNLAGGAGTWATYVGGSVAVSDNQGFSTAVDPVSGDVFIAGYTNALNLPVTVGTFDPALSGLADGFLTKITTNAGGAPVLAWSTYIGGSSYDQVNGLAVDASGFALITGYTVSSDFPITPGSDDMTLNNYDAFLMYFTPAGGLYESTFIGGTSTEYGRVVTTDAALNVYVTGQTYSSDFPILGAFDPSVSNTPDGFVVKYSPTGVKLWASYYGGNDYDYPTGIAADDAGNVYITGYTQSSDFVSPIGGPDSTLGGSYDAFVLKVSTGGARQWSRYLGGVSTDQGNAIDVNPAGTAVIVTGQTSSADFPFLLGFDSTLNSTDAFVTRLDPATGNTVWSTFLGGSSTDIGAAIEVDDAGNAYLAGYTFSSNFPTKGAFDSTWNGLYDVFVAKMYANGLSLAWSSFLGGTGYDYGLGVTRSASGVVYVSGYTNSADFPLTANAFDSTLSSVNDAFIVRLDNAPPAAPDFSVAGAGQFRFTLGTLLPVGGWTRDNTLTIKARLNDGDDDPLQFNVEIKPLGVPFDGLGVITGAAAPAGALHVIDVPFPAGAPAQFHWRCWSTDPSGAASAVVFFGATSDINTPDVGFDDVAPVPIITAPTTLATFYTTSSSTGLSGTVTDDASGPTLVSWANAGPPATGSNATLALNPPATPTWNVLSIGLSTGANVITVTATDAAGNSGFTTITVYRDNTAPSPVSITAPAADPFTSGSSDVDLTIDVGDNLLIREVRWNNPLTGGDLATLTSGNLQSGIWTAAVTGLVPGVNNVITVTAFDQAGNSAVDTITLRYDTAPPGLVISSPGANLFSSALSVALSGSATDNYQIDHLTWFNYDVVGATGSEFPPVGTTTDWNWSVPVVPLTGGSGANTIEVFMYDSVGLVSSQSIVVTRDIVAPTVAVTTPPVSPYTTGSSTIALSGTAADNIGVQTVTVTNVTRGETATVTLGTPNGTSTTWESSPVTLTANVDNEIQVRSLDRVTPTANASAITTIFVRYDTNGPSLSVTSPASSPSWTSLSSVTLVGTATDNGSVTSITCTNTTTGATPAVVPTAPDTFPSPPFPAILDWSVVVPLQTGSNVIRLVAQDNATLSTTVFLTVIYDPTAPTVKITGPTTADDYFTGSATIALAGIAGDNQGVSLVSWTTTGAVGPNPTAGNATNTASWTIPLIDLAPGVQTITVTSRDEAMNTATDTLIVTYDPSLPTITIEVPTVSDTITLDATDTIVSGTASDTFSGVGTITWSNAANGTSGTATGTTNWSIPSVALVAGSNPITVMAFDEAGNLKTDTLVVYRDSFRPSGAITTPATSPYVTNVGTLTLKGTASDDIGVATVSWSNAANSTGGTAAGTSSWEATSITLAPGDNVLTVTVTDGLGKTNLAPITLLVHYDDNFPTLAITDPDAPPNNLDAATNTNASPIVLSGTVGDLNGADVSAAPAQVAWTNLTTGGAGLCVVTGGTWSGSIPLTAGTNLVTVTVTDAAGNSAQSSFSATYDTAAPAVVITTPTPDLTHSTATSPILVAGTATDDVGIFSVTWTTTGVVPTVAGPATGTDAWSFSLDLAAGPNLVTVTTTDVVGRTNTARITITYDPTPPTIAITTPTSEALLQSTVNPITIGGQASDNIDIQSVTWINNTTGEPGLASGTSVWTIGNVTLADGLNDISITATDGVGNTGTTSVMIDYDGLPPVITIDPAFLLSFPLPYSTSTRPLNVTGTATDNLNLATVTWVNSRGGGGSAVLGAGNTWTAPVYLYASPPDNTITFTATDAHGQTATAVLIVTYTPESDAPFVDITSPVAPDSATQIVTLGGTSTDGVGVVSILWRNTTTGVRGSATSSAPAMTPAFSQWTAAVPLTNGPNVIVVTAYDDAGNSATDTITITFTSPDDTLAPDVDIVGPTLDDVWDENVSPMLLTISADDGTFGVGVASVTWTNSGTGGNGWATPGPGTVWTASVALAFGANIITVTAADPAGNSSIDTLIVNFIPTPGDSSKPGVTITSHPTNTNLNVSAPILTLGGIANDDVLLTDVVWSNTTASTSGSAEGTDAWTSVVTLIPGINIISVRAFDSSANSEDDSITVVYTPPPPPPEVVPAGSCGLVGLDALALLLGLAAWRRRRAQRWSGK